VITALIPKEWEVRFIDENISARSRGFRMGGAVLFQACISNGIAFTTSRRAHKGGRWSRWATVGFSGTGILS